MKTYHLLLRLILVQPALYGLFIVFWIVSFGLVLVPGFILRNFFDNLNGNATTTLNLWVLASLLVVIALARECVRVITFFEEPLLEKLIGALLRKNLLMQILARPAAVALTCSPGDALNRFRDDVTEIEKFMIWSPLMVSRVLFLAVALTVMIQINLLITFVVFMPLVLIASGTVLLSPRIVQYRQATRNASSAITELIAEIFGSVQAIQVAGAENRMIGHFTSLNQTRLRATLKECLYSQIVGSFWSNLSNLCIGITLLVAGHEMETGNFTIGDFSLFIYYLPWITGFAISLGDLLVRYKRLGVSFERMAALVPDVPSARLVQSGPVYQTKEPPEVPYTPKTNAHILHELKVSDLTYHYPNTEKGIEGINFVFERGSLVVITGRIGSGKTTLLQALLGLLPKEKGEIIWNKEIVADPASFFVPPRSAFVPQIAGLFSNTLKENILMGLPPDKVDLEKAICLAVLEKDIAELEKGLDTMIGPRGVKLSGGQAQRTIAARSFIREPELMVFDDLSSALDVETEKILWDRLLKHRNATYIVVSHRRAVLERADHVIVLKNGKIEAQGKLNVLLSQCEEMKKLWQNDLS